MNEKIEKVLAGKGENYIFPFFWQHGETEAVLREYMKIIHEANIGAVCVESRPHPDFCGEQWWRDMDILIEEAKKRHMKIWILDDSHFPTGFANGAIKDAPPELCRQSICCKIIDCKDKTKIKLSNKVLKNPPPFKKNLIERFALKEPFRKFDDDELLGVLAVRIEERQMVEIKDLSGQITDKGMVFQVPKGRWKIYVMQLSRNMGPHRNYINMLDEESCRVLIDAVYEPHYRKYKEEFGKTIAGFFSDEPEIGNGHLYKTGNVLGTDQDLPWSRRMHQEMTASYGEEFWKKLILLWENEANPDDIAKIRYTYMDAVTRLVEECFSNQLGNWCQKRNVEYIGHIIEDNNQHARMGSSLGHYFRGLNGQHMAGIDDIGGQVLPQQEKVTTTGITGDRDGRFYHYVLGKLAASHAAIDPKKNGRSMCEIFGNYSWACGVRLEKYLVDHFLVRGINHYVPHAFSPKEYPDRDCPPHFYAGGNNPQYRHFGELMKYTNRVCELISHGAHIAPVAILYHGEGEWTGNCMLMQEPAEILADHQIEYDIIPQDVFNDREYYHTTMGERFSVNGQEYSVLIVPYMQYITRSFAKAVKELKEAGFPVFFLRDVPDGICNVKDHDKALIAELESCQSVPLERLMENLEKLDISDLKIVPAQENIRYHHYSWEGGSGLYLLVNEGRDSYVGKVYVKKKGYFYRYNAWDNKVEELDYTEGQNHTEICLTIEPLQSMLIVYEQESNGIGILEKPKVWEGERFITNDNWMRSTCRSIEYPNFKNGKEVTLPDQLEKEKPKFSGYVRYEKNIELTEKNILLEITDAHEGVEVFVNDKSLGIQIVPPYRYDISEAVKKGQNNIKIEVATTLEREVGRKGFIALLSAPKVSAKSGINGDVYFIQQ